MKYLVCFLFITLLSQVLGADEAAPKAVPKCLECEETDYRVIADAHKSLCIKPTNDTNTVPCPTGICVTTVLKTCSATIQSFKVVGIRSIVTRSCEPEKPADAIDDCKTGNITVKKLFRDNKAINLIGGYTLGFTTTCAATADAACNSDSLTIDVGESAEVFKCDAMKCDNAEYRVLDENGSYVPSGDKKRHFGWRTSSSIRTQVSCALLVFAASTAFVF